jgi:spermidine synthase
MTDRTAYPALSIALVSFCALAYEVLLIKLFSIAQWHHFAYMIISLALLGYGASGTFLALYRTRLLQGFYPAFLGNMLLFGITMPGCYLAAQSLPFNPQELLWDWQQPLWLMLVYLLLVLPFFFAANVTGLALSRFTQAIPRIYAFDLAGAGLGSAGIVLLLFLQFPDAALRWLAALGVVAAALAAIELGPLQQRRRTRQLTAAFLLLAVLPLLLPADWIRISPSPYKGLSQLLQVRGTSIIEERSSPLGLLTVVESREVPIRHAPGLSLSARTEPPPQLAVFTDADGMSVINRFTGELVELAYLDQLTTALPYHLAQPRQVLILGAGGGSGVLQALYHGAKHIDAVELNPQMVELVRERFADYAGHIYQAENVSVHVAEARGFVTREARTFDLIELAQVDAFGASAAGLHALSESYLYTVEALQTYLRHLAPDGYLAISRWVRLPPRDTLKLFATALEAMRGVQIVDPENRLMLIRGWQTTTLVIKNGSVSAGEIARMRQFSEERAFDLAYYPGMPPDEANRYNLLQRPYFYDAAIALAGQGAGDFLQRYKYDLEPATDDRPYFFHFFKWPLLPELWQLRGQGGLPLLEWGYLVLAATLVQALLASLLLIVLPLRLLKHREQAEATAVSRGKVLLYFVSIGLAFLFLEIALIQKFILFLSHPLYAAAVVLSAFLLFAGVGSNYSKAMAARAGRAVAVRRGIAIIVLTAGAYLLWLNGVLTALVGLPDAVRIAVSLLLVAPLAFAMGIPFPLAMTQLGEKAPALIPWAWGVNGCASVLSAVLATLLAIHFGFTVVITLAMIFYLLAAVTFPD